MLEWQSAGSISAKVKVKSGTVGHLQLPLRHVQAGKLFDFLTSPKAG